MTYVFPALQDALERRDMDWQEHLAVLHEGFTGDGCDSGDPRDWTRAAIQMRINSLIDERDEAREQLRLANIDAAESEAKYNDLTKEKTHEALVEALEISVDLLSEELKHSHQKQPHHHTLTYGLNQARAALKLARGEE